MGTFETRFTVPDLTSDQRYLPISSVVLSYQREKLDAAIGTAERDKKTDRRQPAGTGRTEAGAGCDEGVSQGPGNVCLPGGHQPAVERTQFLMATVSFYRGRVKTFETAPLQVANGLNAKSKAVPVTLSVPLESLPAGRYTCQVNLVQPSAQKFAVCRSPMVLLP